MVDQSMDSGDELTPDERREVERRLREEPDIPGPTVMKRLGLTR